MNKKEIIEEVVVSDRTSPMTNPRTYESLGGVEASGEDGPQGGRPSVVVIPERRRRYSSQEKMEFSPDVSSRQHRFQCCQSSRGSSINAI